MSNARKAALHLLNSEWSRGVWKHWLANIFQPPVAPPMPAPAVVVPPAAASAPPAAAAVPPAAATVPPPAPVAREVLESAPVNDQATGKLHHSCVSARSEPPDAGTPREVRRRELRARFDALSDRLLAVEDGVDTLLRRAAQRDKLDRRSEQQSVEMIDNVAVAGERQAAVLEGLLSTVARLEHSMARLEQGLAKLERSVGERRRESHFPAPAPPPRVSPSSFPESQLAPRSARHGDADETERDEGSGINGYLSEVSLSTVLAMLEIERHTGRLKVATEDGMLASFELSEGTVVSSRLSENDADPLQTLRAALCWKQGRFWFRQQPADAPSFAPRSIGSLLLEATRQNDESFANVG
jgi:hypothetical protein